jgi:hypothetical protein
MKHDLPTYLYDTEEHNALRDAGTETSSSVPNIWQNWLTDRAAIISWFTRRRCLRTTTHSLPLTCLARALDGAEANRRLAKYGIQSVTPPLLHARHHPTSNHSNAVITMYNQTPGREAVSTWTEMILQFPPQNSRSSSTSGRRVTCPYDEPVVYPVLVAKRMFSSHIPGT